MSGAPPCWLPTGTGRSGAGLCSARGTSGALMADQQFSNPGWHRGRVRTSFRQAAGWILLRRTLCGVALCSSLLVLAMAAVGVWSASRTPRSVYAATLLANGDVLFTGDIDGNRGPATAVLYHPRSH